MKTVINEKGDFKLLSPFNSWDTNYHLVDTKNDLDHLIDIGDVCKESEVEDKEDFGGLLWEELKELGDIDYILEFSWKTVKW